MEKILAILRGRAEVFSLLVGQLLLTEDFSRAPSSDAIFNVSLILTTITRNLDIECRENGGS